MGVAKGTKKSRSQTAGSRRVRGPEMKELNTAVSATGSTVSITGNVINLSNIPQGVDINNRVGRYVRAKYLDYVIVCSTNVTNDDTFLIGFVMDTQASAATTTYGLIWDIGTANAGYANQNTLQSRMRYRVLMQKQVDMSITGTNLVTLRGRLEIPRDLQEMEFISSSTAPPNTNSLLLTTGCNSITSSALVQYNCKLVYWDD